MKCYGYAISNNEPYIISFTREFPNNTGVVGKVQKNVAGTDYKYLVYLSEENEAKAMSLLERTIKDEIDMLYRQVDVKNKFLDIVSKPIFMEKQL